MGDETQIGDDGFTIDEEFKNSLPPLNTEDFRKLEKSLLEEGGCRDLLIVWQEEKVLIDGHHRYAICKEHGLVFGIDEKSFADRNAVIEWMFENQGGRRNMNRFVWAEAVLKRKSIIEAEAKANQRAGGGTVRLKSDKPVNTLKRLAKLAGVGRDTMHKVSVIIDTAAINPQNVSLKKQIDKLRNNDRCVSISSAFEELQEPTGKKTAAKTSRTKSKRRNIKSAASSPTPKSSNQSPQNLAEQIELIYAFIEDIAEQYPPDDLALLYNTLDKWLSRKKGELILSVM